MKTIAILLLLATPVLVHATDIHPGESLADVKSTLGPPTGQAQIEDKLVLFYDRGQVQLVDGRVVGSDFLSPEDFAIQQAQQKAIDAKASQLRAQRIAEGKTLKAQKLADPNFTSAPPAYQVAFWQDFRLRYPEVSCDDEYKLALARQQEAEQKVADLEARVADAEARAARAERDARLARYDTSIWSPYFIGGVPRSGFREHEDQDDDRHQFRMREHENRECENKGNDCGDRVQLTTLPIIPPVRSLNLPTFPIPPVPSPNLSTPNTSPANPLP
jgi:hypothetical protein